MIFTLEGSIEQQLATSQSREYQLFSALKTIATENLSLGEAKQLATYCISFLGVTNNNALRILLEEQRNRAADTVAALIPLAGNVDLSDIVELIEGDTLVIDTLGASNG